ncbi:CLIP domain-containing serine protease 2-like [Diprion similis]|uniref:CLIP domain-containing serine protease 2-like n=1 Tax=Diprion similis TaxID=362088 RepID=UPI001EF8D60F|nr:CLIP domain-containing serine protease 2-like [Diprion similis]
MPILFVLLLSLSAVQSLSRRDVATDDQSSSEELLPRDCGKDSGQPLDDGSKTGLLDFPWLALIEYKKDSYVIAGWGKTKTSGRDPIKLKFKVPKADFAQCSTTYQNFSINLGEDQFCAGDYRLDNFCGGNGSGPLMQLEKTSEGKSRWIASGLVSFGPNPCGIKNMPDVYTKVSNYLPWIISKIKA